MKAVGALILALVCLIPTAACSSFSASALDVGWDSLAGQPSVLSYISGPSAGSIELTANAVHLESDWKREIVVGEVGHETHPTSTDLADYTRSSWRAESRSADATLFLIPAQATIQAGGGAGTVSLPAVDCEPQPWYFEGPRPPACPATQSSIQLQAHATDWLVSGNFTLVLWAWQGSIATSEGSSGFWSGSQPTDTSLAGFGETELRQAFLTVTGGTLRLNLGSSETLAVYATTLDLTAPTIAGRGMDQPGDLHGTLAEGRLHLQRGDRGRLDPATTSVAPTWRVLPVGMLAGSALLVSVGLLYVRRQKALVHLVLANKNLEMENPRAAARHASKAAWGVQKTEANVLGAIAAMKAEDFSGARRFLRRLHAQSDHDEAACRFLQAHLRVQQGQAAEGQQLLEECLALDPTYSQDAAASPVLAPFLDPSKWPRTVG